MPDSFALLLPDEQATRELGALLARSLSGVGAYPEGGSGSGGSVSLLLQGGLGSGKTTLVRGFVAALPGAQQAEVSSPSFNLMNIYPTTPQVAHFDLYRSLGHAPEEFHDALDDRGLLVVAEWIENIPRQDWPEEALHLEWSAVPSGRALEIRALGKTARGLLESLAPSFNQWRKLNQWQKG